MKKSNQLTLPSYEETEIASYIAYRAAMDEEERIKNYIFEKSLVRPRTNLLTIAVLLFSYLILAFFLGYIVILILNLESWSPLIYFLCYILCFAMLFKFLAIKSIECYQHYAKITTRRKCLCMPTCSEYAIAVLKKYPILIALIKIEKRLFKTCRGNFYKIDLP